MQNMKDTNWDFALVLRQKYQEDVFRTAMKKEGVELQAPYTLVDIQVLQDVNPGGYRILATIEHSETKDQSIVKCRYLIGADGGKSFVRRTLNIPFDGTSTEDKWIRIDGVLETNHPKPRTYCAIESPTHGNVLWAPLDRGATRIGFAFTSARQKAYAEFTQEAAEKEAIEAVKPFSIHFKQVDWWTIYVVGQRIARSFFVHDCIFLVGDACHTHSSGAAQGMNTGIHDAVNLAWKLSLVLKGIAYPDLLNSYEAERLPNVQRLINYDRDISRLMTMQLPEGWKGNPDADPNEVLGTVMAEAAGFSSGLGIFYEQDGYLNVGTCTEDMASVSRTVQAGQRAPDVKLTKPGTWEGTRLLAQTPNFAGFYVLVFTGEVEGKRERLGEFVGAVGRAAWVSGGEVPVSWITVVSGRGVSSAYEALGGMMPFGRVFYDEDDSAVSRYGVDKEKGGMFVLRPDGWVGMVLALDGSAGERLDGYFGRFLVGVGDKKMARL